MGRTNYSDTYPFSLRYEGEEKVVFNQRTGEVLGRHSRTTIDADIQLAKLAKNRNSQAQAAA